MPTHQTKQRRSSVRVWQSFSCNNSSNYRLVARFDDAAVAQDVVTELTGFLAEASPLAGYRARRDRRPLTTATSFPFTEKLDALAAEHGFDWSGLLVDSVYDRDDLEVIAEGTSVLVYHPYCLGLGSALPAYLRARGADLGGASTGGASTGAPTISVLIRLSSESGVLQSELSAFFAQKNGTEDTRGWAIKPPWTTTTTTTTTTGQIFTTCTGIAFFCEGKTLGFYIAIDPNQIVMLKDYLQNAGIEAPQIRICELTDLAKFQAIAVARCSHCTTPLEYLDMHEHGIEADHLACAQCGGMFDLASFT